MRRLRRRRDAGRLLASAGRDGEREHGQQRRRRRRVLRAGVRSSAEAEVARAVEAQSRKARSIAVGVARLEQDGIEPEQR